MNITGFTENNTKNYMDGLINVASSIVQQRNALRNNEFRRESNITYNELRQIYKTGLGNKIARLKAEQSLKKTLEFETQEDEEFYNHNLAHNVKLAAKFMVAFGRGVIVLLEKGADPSQPLPELTGKKFNIRVFSGDLVSSGNISYDLENERYYKPLSYQVRGHNFHHSRVIDFTYVEPTEHDAPTYYYGGIPEFELIYKQLQSDAIVERASPSTLEKNSTPFYKVNGLREAMMSGNDDRIIKFFKNVEDMRSIYGAGIIDKEDEITTLNQTLQNLSEIDQITLRRIAMVTSIPLAILIGENVKGLNSTGENEMTAFQQMLESLQETYLFRPINQLMEKIGRRRVNFKENQGDTPDKRIKYEAQAIDSAFKLFQMGEDSGKYLEDKGILKSDQFEDFFNGRE